MRQLSLLFFIVTLSLNAQTPADQILAKAKAYHDPQDIWPSLEATFTFKETRPESPDRSTVIKLDNGKSYMKINRNDEEVYEVTGSVAAVLKGDRDKERALTLRNYYLYIWGLPMKLYDSSTPPISLAGDEKVNGSTCKVLRVAYQEDTWYFYFDRDTGRMLQYKFYQDAAETEGELITLEDEIMVNGIKIPQKRSWYTLPEMEYLGTDVLVEVD